MAMTHELVCDLLQRHYGNEVVRSTGERPTDIDRVQKNLSMIADHFAPRQGSRNLRKRGLFITGPAGTGKTTAIRALVRTIQQLVDMKLLSSYESDRYPKIVMATELARIATQDLDRYEMLKNCDRLIIDDLGMEPTEVMSFGMPLHPLEDLLAYRYDRRSETYIATNFPYAPLFLGGEGMRPKYTDPRLEDRLHETMTVVNLLGRSYR